MNDFTYPIPRRTFIRRTAVLAGSGALASMLPGRVHAAEKVTVVNSIRSLSNPYHATWNQGGQAFANAIGADYVTLVTEGDSERGSPDIRAVLAKTGGNRGLNVDPNGSPGARPIDKTCVQAVAEVRTRCKQ